MNKETAQRIIYFLEICLDADTLTDAEKGELASLLNFLRLYYAFA